MPAELTVRHHAAQILARVVRGTSLTAALAACEMHIRSRDIALLRQICYTTCRHWFTLNAQLERLLKRPLKRKDLEIKTLLLVGLCQLVHMRTPAHAVVHETVSACDGLNRSWARGLVNALLRNHQRQTDSHRTPAQREPASAAINSDLPLWLYDMLAAAWGERLSAIIDGTNTPGPMTLRVNTKKIARDQYRQMLDKADMAATNCAFADSGVGLQQAVDVALLPGFNEGLVSVQDEAAQLAAGLLACRSGDRVLDACAAPGGKTCHILEEVPGLQMQALDQDAARLRSLEENLQRLALPATVTQGDVCQPDLWWDGRPFDRILLDAPCSATGVIRRHPDIKLLRRVEDISTLCALQAKALDSLWPLVKPGGTLLYATCSILAEENSEQIRAFLARTDDAQESTPHIECGIATGYGEQFLPTPRGLDGFFYARLHKKEQLCP